MKQTITEAKLEYLTARRVEAAFRLQSKFVNQCDAIRESVKELREEVKVIQPGSQWRMFSSSIPDEDTSQDG